WCRCRNSHRTQKALTCSSTQHACHQRPGTAHLGPEQVADTVLARLGVAGGGRDDVALVVARL
ncbi:hypothetical protein, partial [Streptomyces griseofuscus]|uniref:hypothetical protein n=1 Tax=Streptomyces griseofuscus TaxID=146922 RepID=UPI0012FEABCC